MARVLKQKYLKIILSIASVHPKIESAIHIPSRDEPFMDEH
jgi:hypothetical protein